MIVNRSHAEEAAKLLHFATLDGLTADRVQIAYRAMAQQTHPDAGGSIEQFAAVNHAKQVLTEWLRRVGESDARRYQPIKCEVCSGTGRKPVHRGWKVSYVMCGACGGTGDGGYDRSKERSD